MDKAQLITRTQEVLKPFESQNVLTFIHEVNAQTLTDNPRVTFLLALALAYSLWRWSRTVLLFLFTILSISMLIRYTLPAAGAELSISSTFPFVLGCMGIASVLLYFFFIRAE